MCHALTTDEVAAELKQPVVAKRLPKMGEYGAPKCGWFTLDEQENPKLEFALFFHPESERGPRNFAEKVKDVCKDEGKKLDGLGDEAVLCRLLLVRKRNNFFYLGQGRKPLLSWPEGAERLAHRIVARLE